MTRWLMVALVVVLFAREAAMQYAAPTARLRCLFVSDYQMAIMIGIFLPAWWKRSMRSVHSPSDRTPLIVDAAVHRA
jgi:hypothetical protein